jgi:hypothetical protein
MLNWRLKCERSINLEKGNELLKKVKSMNVTVTGKMGSNMDLKSMFIQMGKKYEGFFLEWK